MSPRSAQAFLAARIPVSLKNKLSRYCLSHGVKMSYFVVQAIQNRLLELIEDQEDLAIAKERLKTAEYASQEELDKRFPKRSSGF